MARILVVDDDGVVARDIARSLREVGHIVALATNGRSALLEVADGPDVILLDLGLPDLSGEALLTHLRSDPHTASIPILIVTGRRDAASRLRESAPGSVVDIVHKPVSGAKLRQAVEATLARHWEVEAEDALGSLKDRQCHLIERLIVEGSDSLVFQTCRRLSCDRTRGRGSLSGNALSWTEISERAKNEGVLDAEQARLLCRIPATKARVLRKAVAWN